VLCPLEEIEGNYASLAELANAHHIRVIFSSVLPIHNYTPQSTNLFVQRSPEKIRDLNRWLRDYCVAQWLYISGLFQCHG